MSDIARVLVETTVRQAMKEIQGDPERSIRNLVDMALNFSNGRFQKYFFQTAQGMLGNEKSAYYGLVEDAVSHVDTERLISIGMNIGYNSCTAGAKVIRRIEEEKHFNVPWSLSLVIDEESCPAVLNGSRILICEGKALGIYTWFLYCRTLTADIFRLCMEQDDCAFIIFISGENMTEELLEQAKKCKNLLFVINWDEYVQAACKILREKKFPYGINKNYDDGDVDEVLSGAVLSEMEKLHPIFGFFRAGNVSSKETRAEVYQYIRVARAQQKNQIIPMDIIYDNQFIDSIISTDVCTAGFDIEGQLYSVAGQTKGREYNFYENSLKEILKKAFPKISS